MKKKLISYAAVAVVLTACSSEEPITPPNQVNDAMGANPYRVSLTDALKMGGFEKVFKLNQL